MPYQSITDLPEALVQGYDEMQRRAFLDAYNRAYEKYSHDEATALASAHQAAQEARKKPEEYRKGTMAKNRAMHQPH